MYMQRKGPYRILNLMCIMLHCYLKDGVTSRSSLSRTHVYCAIAQWLEVCLVLCCRFERSLRLQSVVGSNPT